MKVYGSVWFSQMNTIGVIGIISCNNGYEDKAYIGIINCPSMDKDDDVNIILERGTPFPFEQAIALTGGK